MSRKKLSHNARAFAREKMKIAYMINRKMEEKTKPLPFFAR